MDNIEEEITRKVKMRKFAKNNLGTHNYINADSYEGVDELDILSKLYSDLNENILDADQCKFQDGYNPIYSKRKKVGRIVVFIKRVIRKIINILLGWYIKPIFEKQSFYNSKILNAINLISYIEKTDNQKYLEKLAEKEKRIKVLESNYSLIADKISKIEDKTKSMNELSDKIDNLSKKVEYILAELNISCDLDLLKQNDVDYFKFENIYRGDRSGVKDIQSVYLPYFKNNSNGTVLDIGCGRGEFLELLWENGVRAYGIDNYEPFVKYCNERGLSVKKGDALTHLNSLDDNSLGGIFMSQVVEHLSNDYVRNLIKTSYKKLMPGSYFIIETPNPDCLAAISEFNIDMSHIKPVHYKALEYLFKESNYQSVERYHTEQCVYPVKARHIKGEGITNIDEFNQGIDHINELLFGYRDYTLIAKK